MINTTTLIQNIKTDLDALEWDSIDGGGKTDFVGGVFTYPNWNNADGYPYAVIADPLSTGQPDTNKYVRMDNTIEIHVCSNWAVVGEEADVPNSKREECMLRIREAINYLKTYVVLDSTLIKWAGTSAEGWQNEITIQDAPVPELNLFRKVIKMKISEMIRK